MNKVKPAPNFLNNIGEVLLEILAITYLFIIMPILIILYIPTLGWSWQLHGKIVEWKDDI